MLTLNDLKPENIEKIVTKDPQWKSEDLSKSKKSKRWKLSDLFKKKK